MLQKHIPPAFFTVFTVGSHQLQILFMMLYLIFGARSESATHFYQSPNLSLIRRSVIEFAETGLPISSSLHQIDPNGAYSPSLLVITLEGLRKNRVDNIAHIFLVYAHSISDRGTNNTDLIRCPRLLHADALSGSHARMIISARNSVPFKLLIRILCTSLDRCEPTCLLSRQHIHDPAVLQVFLNKRNDFVHITNRGFSRLVGLCRLGRLGSVFTTLPGGPFVLLFPLPDLRFRVFLHDFIAEIGPIERLRVTPSFIPLLSGTSPRSASPAPSRSPPPPPASLWPSAP